MKMLRETKGQQLKYELVMIENLVPENHLLRKIDKVIDFSFINEICKPYYCADNGRPAIEPETLFKMLFIGYLYGIRSETKSETKTIKTSTTDPDSGFMHREGKPKGFFYLDHRTVDSKNNIITDVFVTPGNTNDVKPYIKRLDVQIEKFGFDVKAVGLDAGYNVSAICKQLFDRGIKAVRIVNTRPIPQSDCKAINLLFACYGDCFYTKFSGLPLNMILCFFFFCLKTRHLQLLMYSISLPIFLTSMSFRTYFL